MHNSLRIFTGNLDNLDTKKWIEMLEQQGMICEFPDNFTTATAEGEIFVKMQVNNTGISAYENKTIKAQFSIEKEIFDYKSFVKTITPKLSLIQKITGVAPNTKLVTREIDEILSNSDTKLTFSWERHKPEAFRIGAFSAAIVADLCNGVLNTPNSNSFYDKTGLIDIISYQVFLYERSLSRKEWKLDEV
jgi:hypothetical protein